VNSFAISNIGASRDEGLKWLDFVVLTDRILKSFETEDTGKLRLINEENDMQEPVVGVTTLIYECTYTGKEKDLEKRYLQGQIDEVDAKGDLLQKRL